VRGVFLRIYAVVIGTLLLVFGGTFAYFFTFVRADFESEIERAIEPAMASFAREISRTAQGSPEREALLSHVRQRVGPSVTVLPLAALEIDEADRERLRAGEYVSESHLPGSGRSPRGLMPIPGEDAVVELRVSHPFVATSALPLAFDVRGTTGEPAATALRLEREETARLTTSPMAIDAGRSFVWLNADGELRRAPAPFERPDFPRWLLPLLCLVLVGVGIALVIVPMQRQLVAVERATQLLSDGDLDARAQLPTHGPLSDLGHRFDEMAERVQTVLENNEDLMRAVSHELRTPIARLLFALDLVRSAETDEKREEHLAKAEASVEELGELSAELLELARLGETSPKLSMEPIDLGDVARRAYSAEMDACAETALREVEGESVPVSADRRLVTRAVANVVRNARRHGGGTVKVSLERVGDRARVHVDDDGPGIPLEERQRVLEPFQRLDESRNRESGGVGLGLAISRRIVERHGGAIEIDESPTLRGARVTLELPIA
jgi:two-component system sensor histidine kinase RstB